MGGKVFAIARWVEDVPAFTFKTEGMEAYEILLSCAKDTVSAEIGSWLRANRWRTGLAPDAQGIPRIHSSPSMFDRRTAMLEEADDSVPRRRSLA